MLNVECRIDPETTGYIDPDCFIKHYKNIFEQIETVAKRFSDQTCFHKLYAKKIQRFKEGFARLCSKTSLEVTYDPAKHMILQKDFLSINGYEHNDQFVDIKILHSLLFDKKHKTIFIYAGGMHIANIKDVLITDLGYESVDRKGGIEALMARLNAQRGSQYNTILASRDPAVPVYDFFKDYLEAEQKRRSRLTILATGVTSLAAATALGLAWYFNK